MAMINKLILWLMRAGIGLLIIGLILFWLDCQTEKRVDAAFESGKAECAEEYAKKVMQSNSEIQNKTQEILKYKRLLLEQRKELSDDCQTIFNIDLTACRQQLRNKAGS